MDSFRDAQAHVQGHTPHVDVYHGMLAVSNPHTKFWKPSWHRRHHEPAKRGDVERFSPASRRRLRQTLASVHLPALPNPEFVTLTYHNEWAKRSHATDLANWFRAIQYHYGPVHYIWRVELQKRGAPHFHVLMWQNHPETVTRAEYLRTLREAWANLTQQHTAAHRRYGFHSAHVDAGLGALMRYLRKYLAKEDAPDHDHPYRGRRWAASRGLPTSPYLRVDLSGPDSRLLRRFVRNLLRARFRHQKNASLKTRLITSEDTVHVYIDWMAVLRWMHFHGILSRTNTDTAGLPWDHPCQ